MMLATRIIHLYISTHYFPKDVALWPKWTCLDCQHQGDFTLQCHLPCAPCKL